MATIDDVVILRSAARTATTDSDDMHNDQYHSAHIVIDVTAVAGSPSLTPRIQGKDRASGKYYDLVVGAPITATGTVLVKLGLGMGGSTYGFGVAPDFLPTDWRVQVTHGTADSCTYSVGASLCG